MKKVVVLALVFVFLLAISTSADVDTGFSCSLNCDSLSQNGESYYCNPDTQTCFLLEAPSEVTPTPVPEEVTPVEPTTEEKIAALEGKVAGLESDLTALSSDLSLTKGEILTVQSQISSLQAELAALQSSDQDLSSKANTLATGLASLQQTLDSLQKTLTERQAFSRIITVVLVILVIAGVAGGVYYYIGRKPKVVGQEIIEYINSNIKVGKKLHHIKEELRKAGWADRDIEKAYQETIKQNYRRYKAAQPAAKEAEPRPAVSRAAAQKPAPSLAYEPKKMIIIAVVSIMVITGALLALRATTGQAIFFKKLVGGEETGTTGEVTYKVECTPPHLLNPAGDACCLDSDNSGVCDTTELQGLGLGEGGDCADNRECKPGLYCINKKCASLNDLYTGEGDCTKLCSYYAIKMLTSDGEQYDLKPRQGSYTAAGALEWKTLEMPQHCKRESSIVPVNILKKKTGEIISEEVILLHEGEKSPVLTHPTLPKIAFSLTVADVFESCPK